MGLRGVNRILDAKTKLDFTTVRSVHFFIYLCVYLVLLCLFSVFLRQTDSGDTDMSEFESRTTDDSLFGL